MTTSLGEKLAAMDKRFEELERKIADPEAMAQGAVYAAAYYYAGRYGAAEDIAQDAFFEAYRSLRQLKEANRFGPWMKGIACRTAANWLRKYGKRLQAETPLPIRNFPAGMRTSFIVTSLPRLSVISTGVFSFAAVSFCRRFASLTSDSHFACFEPGTGKTTRKP